MRLFYVIAEPCGGCKDRGCVQVCPVDCIREGTVEHNERTFNQLFIDPEECIFCGLCEPECPVDAIFARDELPEPWREYQEVNAAFFRQRQKGAR